MAFAACDAVELFAGPVVFAEDFVLACVVVALVFAAVVFAAVVVVVVVVVDVGVEVSFDQQLELAAQGDVPDWL